MEISMNKLFQLYSKSFEDELVLPATEIINYVFYNSKSSNHPLEDTDD